MLTRSCLLRVAIVLAAVCISGPVASGVEPVALPGTTHDKTFWLSITKNQYAVPAGESVAGLSSELVDLLGSPDPELRDEVGYSVLTAWIYEKKLLSPADLRPMIAKLEANLAREIGSVGTDAVLRRSFSALVLSVIVARDNTAPFLEEPEFHKLLQAAVGYEGAEKDLRGYDPEKGWIHSAAHTADLLKFLARSRYITKADQAEILAALGRKLQSATSVFTFGEDERMARAALSIVGRADFDDAGFDTWLASCKPKRPEAARPTVAEMSAYQNVKNFLSKLEVVLLSAPAATPHASATAAKVEDTLKGAF